jgi:hypothetical protein
MQQAVLGSQAPCTLASCLAPDPPAVLAVALLDKIVSARIWLGLRQKTRRAVVRDLWLGFLAVTLFVSCLGYLHGGRPGMANLNALIILLFIAMMMRSARKTWWSFQQLAASLDAIVVDADERRDVAERMHRRLRWPLQLALAGASVAAGLVLGLFIARTTGSHGIANWVFVPVDAVAVAIAVNVIYWLWVAVVWLSGFSRLRSIELATDPEADPALEGSLGMVRDVRLRVLVGLIVAELPPAVLLIATDGGLLPLVACGAVLALGLVTGVAIGVLPVIYIGRVRRTDRNNTVAQMVDRYEDACGRASASERLELDRVFYETVNEVRRRSVYPLNAESLALIVATVAGPAVPFVLAVMFGLDKAAG